MARKMIQIPADLHAQVRQYAGDGRTIASIVTQAVESWIAIQTTTPSLSHVTQTPARTMAEPKPCLDPGVEALRHQLAREGA